MTYLEKMRKSKTFAKLIACYRILKCKRMYLMTTEDRKEYTFNILTNTTETDIKKMIETLKDELKYVRR